MNEKRRHFRIETDLGVWYHTFNQEDISHGRPKSKNVSSGGMFLLLPNDEKIGASMLIKFRIPHCQEKILITGKVVHVEKINAQDFGVGVEFHSIRDEDAKAINDFVAEKQ